MVTRILGLAALLCGCELGQTPSASTPAVAWFPDVGQGQATVVSSGDQCIMIDAGPASGSHDWITRLPCTRLEAILITHWDLDHRGGLEAVFARLPVGALLYGHLPKDDSVQAKFDNFCRLASNGCKSVRPGQNLSYLPGIRWQVLFTGPDSLPDDNETSVVSRLSDVHGSLLVAGDLDSLGEQALAATHGSALHSNLLLISHHGSAGSNSLAWLGAVRPKLAIAQAGRNNRYGHPSPSVLGRLQALGIPTWITSDLGGMRTALDGSSRTSF
jgi:competence protein ComEC